MLFLHEPESRLHVYLSTTDRKFAEVKRIDGLFPGVQQRVDVEGRQGEELAGRREGAAGHKGMDVWGPVDQLAVRDCPQIISILQ